MLIGLCQFGVIVMVIKFLAKSVTFLQQKQGKGPAQGEQTLSGKSYGDLFEYTKSGYGNGLAVTGFRGEKNQTIIFQNRFGNKPVIEIAAGSFESTQIEEAILTEGINRISEKAFANCNKLHQVVLPMSVEEIADNAFENCYHLKSISLPAMLKTIGIAAFKGTGLRTIDLPKSVYWIGEALMATAEIWNE